jgi:hypothetical protein
VAAPITDDPELQANVRRLHAAGRGRNEIADELGVSRASVSKVARIIGVTFDRAEQVATANAVRSADLAARRLDTAEDLQAAAERLTDQLFAPHVYFDWGGKDHSFAKHEAPEPIPADKRALMSAIATALDRSMRLVPPREDGGAQSRSVLGDLMAGLARDYAERHGGPPPELEPPPEPDEDA